jgi:O-antigen ligase
MLLITALVPLAIAPGLVSAFDITPKIAILLFCESGLLLFCKQLVNGLPALYKSTRGRVFIVCLAAQWLSTAASTLWSSNPSLSLRGSSWRRDGLIAESAILLFALLVAGWFAEDSARIRVVLRATTVTGIAAALYGITQYFGWDALLPSKAYQAGEDMFTIVRPPSTFGHADYSANWLVIVVFLALALRDTAAIWKGIVHAAMFLMTLAIILSGTRSALLGLLAGAVVFLALARPRVDRKAILTIAAILACLTLFYVSPAGAKLRARVHWSLDDIRGGARLLLWKDSLRMATHRPLLGYGPETFTAQFPPFESVDLARAYPDFYHESPHNMFLDALVSCGIPGALSLLALCVIALWSAGKIPALAAALTGALVCQQFMVLTIPTSLYFYLLIALIAVGGRRSSRQPPIHAVSWITIPIAALFLFTAVRLLIADRSMAVAEQHIQSAEVAAASAAYKIAQRWSPTPGETDLRYSRAMTRLATTTRIFSTSVAAAQQASDAAMRATETTEDRQNAWYNLATIAALRNDRAGVEQALRRGIDCAPNWFKPHWTLAQLLELTGRHAEARQEAVIALQLNGGHDSEVTATSQTILSRP